MKKIYKKITCKLCHENFDNITSLSRHIKCHRIKKKEYYDKFIRKKNKGTCKLCGNETSFISMNKGYRTFCSKSCERELRDLGKKLKIYQGEFKCDTCSHGFDTADGLNKHRHRMKHLGSECKFVIQRDRRQNSYDIDQQKLEDRIINPFNKICRTKKKTLFTKIK